MDFRVGQIGLVDAEGNRICPFRHHVQFVDLDLSFVDSCPLDILLWLLNLALHQHY